MAELKVKLRKSSIKCNLGTIYYQIIHGKTICSHSTSYHFYPEEWNSATLMGSPMPDSERTNIIYAINRSIRLDVDLITQIIRTAENDGIPFRAEDIIKKFIKVKKERYLYNFMEKLIEEIRTSGRYRTAENYSSALNSFKKFMKNEDVSLNSINSKLMESYQRHLQSTGIMPNTISFYMRILRAVYNKAVDQEIIESRNPFRHVYTGIDKTVKRAISIEKIRKIKALNLSFDPMLDYARDMFLMSFYLRGMSFIDMAFLQKKDLINGHITYRRRKTGQPLTIKWTAEMQFILEKYPQNPTPYLLPIICKSSKTEHYVYRNINYKINILLKEIARLAGIKTKLTMYCARHSWASAAQSRGIPINVIREGMGHSSETTTLIYLASLDTSIVDRANALILNIL